MTIFVGVALIMVMLAALKSRSLSDRMAIGISVVAGVLGFHYHEVPLLVVSILILAYANRHWVIR